MYKIDEIAIVNGKEVKVLGYSGGKVICRYVEDIEGKHPNRCYLYSENQLLRKERELVQVFELFITDARGVEVYKVPFTKYPNKEEILSHIQYNKGIGAHVKKRFLLI